MAVKVMVSFPEKFLEEVDRIAQEEHRSRSELLREAMRLYMDMRRGSVKPGEISEVRRAVAIQDAFAGQAPGTDEDSSIDLRNWRDAH